MITITSDFYFIIFSEYLKYDYYKWLIILIINKQFSIYFSFWRFLAFQVGQKASSFFICQTHFFLFVSGFSVHRLEDPSEVELPLTAKYFRYHAPCAKSGPFINLRQVSARFAFLLEIQIFYFCGIDICVFEVFY